MNEYRLGDVYFNAMWEGVLYNNETWRVVDQGNPVAFVVPAEVFLAMQDKAAPLHGSENGEAPAPKGGHNVWVVIWERSGRLYGAYADRETADIVAGEVRKTYYDREDEPVVEELHISPSRVS